MDYNENRPFANGTDPVGSYTVPSEQKKKLGFPIATLILGILSLFGFCCCCINVITAPLAIIFGIIALVKKHDGTGLTITGIVFAVVSIVMVGAIFYSFRDILPYSDVIMQDYMQLIEEQDEVFPAYEADGTLPEYMKKYTETPFAEFFEKYDITIYDVMDELLEQYHSGALASYEFAVSGEPAAA